MNNAQDDWREDYHRLKIIERQERERYNAIVRNSSSGQPLQQNTFDYANRNVPGGEIGDPRYHPIHFHQQDGSYPQRQSQQPIQQPLLAGMTHQDVFYQQDKERAHLANSLHSAQTTSSPGR